MKILVLDNYDSFTFNLVHILRELGHPPDVYRNDRISLDDVAHYDKIMLSPGPGVPDEAGIMKEVIKQFGGSKSILGVCLGHQGIAEVFGARLYNIPKVLHGVTSTAKVIVTSEKLFRNVPSVFRATHYHSWAVVPESIPPDLIVTSVNEEGLIMALAHKTLDIRGVQFHPESVMTEHGPTIIKNWLS
jgi:anthranilate synthase component II